MDRPSGLPQRREKEHDAFKDTDFATVLDGMSYYNGRLCDACDSIDFAGLTDVLTPASHTTLSLNEAFDRSSSCVFCCVLLTAASKRPALFNSIKQRSLECVVLAHQTDTTESWQKQRYPVMLIAVYVKSSKEPKDVPWLPDWFYDQRQGHSANVDLEFIQEDPLIVLELLEQPAEDLNMRREQHMDQSIDESEGEDPGGKDPGGKDPGGKDPGSEDSGSEDARSEEPDSEAAYIARNCPSWHKGWRWRQFRKAIAPQIDYANLKARLENFDVQKSSQNLLTQLPKRNILHWSFIRLIEGSRFRLINVITGNVEVVRDPKPYVALSYVWGALPMASGVVVPLGHKYESQIAWSVNWQLVPKTIQDARVMVHQLGLQHLWIDSLCIDQEDQEDKRAIIPEMTSIYGRADVTVNAIAGSDAHFGLPGVRIGSRKPDICLSFANRGKDISLVPKRPSPFSRVHNSVWNTRAWTYQEYMLSPRCIFVTEVETLLVLGNAVTSESYVTRPRKTALELSGTKKETSQPLAPKLTVHEALILPESPLWSNYGDAVAAYSPRKLSKLGDRLAAFVGIFSRFREDTGVSGNDLTWSGLPQQWFYASLLWEHVYTNRQLVRIAFDETQSKALPSWSWVGWSGPMKLHESRMSSKTQAVKAYVMNEANIKCESLTLDRPNAWPFHPLLCTIPPSEGITLHLWATRIELYTRPRPIPNAYRVVHQDANNTEEMFLGTFELEPSMASKLCNGQKQQFIIFGRLFMLVEKIDEYYERRAVGRFLPFDVNDGSVAAHRITSCVERLGILEHIRLR